MSEPSARVVPGHDAASTACPLSLDPGPRRCGRSAGMRALYDPTVALTRVPVLLAAIFTSLLLTAPADATKIPTRRQAVVALKKQMARYTHHRVWKYGKLTCVNVGGGGVWKCEWAGGRADVGLTKRGKLAIRIVCTTPGTAVKRGCR